LRRTDIELVDTKAEQEKRRAALREKTARLEAARKNVEQAIAEGSGVKTVTPTDFQVAADNLYKEFNFNLLKPIAGDSGK
jgi:hypothetical protein